MKTPHSINRINVLKSLFIIYACTANSQDKRPNILFAISDDQSYAHTSFEGCEFVNTPAFDRVANEGVYFSNCYAGSPGSAPSRSSIVTGRYPWQNEQSGQHASSWMKKYVPFTDELANHGYIVGRTGKGVDPFRYKISEADSLFRVENAAGPSHSEIKYTNDNDERPATGISDINYFENFKFFIDNIKGDKPFFFWYGAKEPHRGYEKDSWKRTLKNRDNVVVPKFLPENDVIKGDLLDYAIEIEWFDHHLQCMLEYLETIGELENTIVIVTSDNGMPFPRAKANTYNYGTHVPLAIRYPKEFKSKIVIKEPASFINIAPTILEMTKTVPAEMQEITGESMVRMLKTGVANKNTVALSGRERHTYARHNNLGYPQRAIRDGDYLLIWNMRPTRWPAGQPRAFDNKDTTLLLPIGKAGSFADIDGSPSKGNIIASHIKGENSNYMNLATEKRPEFELYKVATDPDCLTNLAENEKHKAIFEKMKFKLKSILYDTKDPRLVGPDYDIFDSYERYSSHRKYPKQEGCN